MSALSTDQNHTNNKQTWLGWNLWTMDKICKYISILICIIFMDVKLYVNVLSDNCLWIIMNTLMLCKTITFQLCTHGSVALSHHRKHCYLYNYIWQRLDAVTLLYVVLICDKTKYLVPESHHFCHLWYDVTLKLIGKSSGIK